MGMLSVHGDAIWTKECAYDVLRDRSHHIQGFYLEVFNSIHGQLDGLWTDKGSSHKSVIDIGNILKASYCIEFKEVHILCTFWDVSRAHCM